MKNFNADSGMDGRTFGQQLNFHSATVSTADTAQLFLYAFSHNNNIVFTKPIYFYTAIKLKICFRNDSFVLYVLQKFEDAKYGGN